MNKFSYKVELDNEIIFQREKRYTSEKEADTQANKVLEQNTSRTAGITPKEANRCIITVY